MWLCLGKTVYIKKCKEWVGVTDTTEMAERRSWLARDSLDRTVLKGQGFQGVFHLQTHRLK